MTRRRLDRTTQRLAERLDRAAEIIPNVRTHLDEQRRHIAIIAAAAAGGTGRQPGTHADPTARAAHQLAHLHRLEGYIDDALASINVGINLLDEACRNALGHRAPEPVIPEASVCYIAGCDSYVETWTTTAGRTVERTDGLCVRHRKQLQRGTLDA